MAQHCKTGSGAGRDARRRWAEGRRSGPAKGRDGVWGGRAAAVRVGTLTAHLSYPFYSGRTRPDWAASGPSHAGVQASRTRAEPPPSLQNCNKASKTLSIYILAYSVRHIYN